MSSKPRLAIVAGDPGGGAALVPVVELLDALQWPCHLYAYAESFESWTARGWPVRPAEQLQLDSIGGLICATSVNAQMYELDWLAAARAQGVPSLAVLDFWSNYLARFQRAGQTTLPDALAVPDALAREEMIAAGFDAASLHITGQPALDRLASITPLSPARRRALREACGVREGQQLALWVSQPLRMIAQRLGQPPVIDEQQACLALEQALAQLGEPIALRVKPHPRESRADFAALGQVWPDSRLVPDSVLAHELLICADIVIGIHSMMLFEACQLGCRVLSYQAGLAPEDDPLPSNRAGWSWRCAAAEALPAMLKRALTESLPRPPKPDGLAAQRIIEQMAYQITAQENRQESA